MKEIKKAVKDFLDDHLRHYSNVHDVMMLLNEDNSMCVSTNWWVDPGNSDYSVDLTIESSYDQFINLFKITSLDQLHQIDHYLLFEKYQEGLAEINCILDDHKNYYTLTFQIKDQGVWATDESDNSHRVYVDLQAPTEFMEYTKRYRLFQKSSDPM